MHLKPAMFLKLGSFLPRFVFNNKCLEFAYFKVEVVSYIMYFLSRNGWMVVGTFPLYSKCGNSLLIMSSTRMLTTC